MSESLTDIVMRAEKALMACLLLCPADRAEILPAVDWAWMLDPKDAAIGRAMAKLEASGKTIDPTTIAAELLDAGHWDTLVSGSDISKIMSRYFTPGNGPVYVGQIRDYATLQMAEKAGEEITAAARSGMPTDKVVAMAAKKIDALTANMDQHETIDLASAIGKTLESLRLRMTDPVGDIMGASGIDGLDHGTAGGLRANQLTILAARPSVGKSSLACQYATASSQKGPVLFVTLEMTWMELAERMLVQNADVDFGRVRDGSITEDERQRLVESSANIRDMPLHVMDAANVTVREIVAKARSIKRKAGGLKLVVIDYLQLLTPDNPRLPRQEQVATMSRDLKNGAKSLECPILCLAQLNRESEKNNRAPRLSDLRESGSIEQDADVVQFLWRPDDRERDKVEIVIAKQRNGPVGKVPLKWDGRRVRFDAVDGPARFTEFDAHNDFGFEPMEGDQ